jgi:hypothetical protein
MDESKTPRAMHHRCIDHQSWLHEDGCLEIESKLIDRKAYDSRTGFNRALQTGKPVHDMTIRILLGPDWCIRNIDLSMRSTPFDVCSEVIRNFKTLQGASMGKGWNALLSERFAGAGGCRHLIDLLRGMATVAFQSMSRGDWTPEILERFTDSCYAFRQGGPVLVRLTAETTKRDDAVDE